MKYFHKAGPAASGKVSGSRHHCAALAVGMLFSILGRVEATDRFAATPSLRDVSTAVAAAVDGDTVFIPAGTATWTNTLTISKAITLQGAGVGSTIIKDGLASSPLMSWTLVPNKVSRLTGIEFQDGGGTSRLTVLQVSGSNSTTPNFRWDNCKWNNLKGQAHIYNVIGVIDHNTFIGNSSEAILVIHNPNWNGGVNGDKSWTDATNFGSSQWLFIETNDISFVSPTNVIPVTDGYEGARFVLRYNTIHDGYIASHGTDSSGRGRGTRAMEVYNNTFIGTNLNNLMIGTRSGTWLAHDNNESGYWYPGIFAVTNFRHQQVFYVFGGADETNPWDVNDAGGIFFTGTAAAPSVTGGYSCTVRASGTTTWTTDQWKGYTIRRTTNLGGATGERFGYILSNTGNSGSPANQITYTLTIFSPNPAAMTFATGDSIEIRKVDNALDQPGMGQATDLIQDVTHTVTTTAGSANIGWTGHGLNVGTSAYLTLNGVTTYYFIISRTTDAFQVSKSPYGPAIVSSSSGSTSATVTVNSRTGNAAWPQEASEPCRSWNNAITDHGNAPINIQAGSAGCRENVHFINGTPLPGYTPFTYPHPLVSGASPTPTPSPSPAAPTNLRITGP